ncbi:MAG: protein kinase, partial [Myxococcota bacterium]
MIAHCPTISFAASGSLAAPGDLAERVRPGSIIGRDFEIVDRLGEGAMGVVFRAHQLTTGYPRAVKIMHKSYQTDPRARERFEQETLIASRLRSEHVVQVVAGGIDEDTPWFAMELLEGEDLGQRLERGPLPPPETADIITQVGHALGAAHDVGIVHRDIKPEHMFLCRSRRAGVPRIIKLIDFGIAKRRSDLRQATIAVGTPAYMAPEQTDGTLEVNASADVWSLALVVFQMITGRSYWCAVEENRSMTQLWRELLIDPLPRASERAAQWGVGHRLPPYLDPWFFRCLNRMPEERFREAREAVDAVLPLLRAEGRTCGPGPRSSFAPPSPHNSDDPGGVGKRRFRSSGPKHPRLVFREEGERISTSVAPGTGLLDASIEAGLPHYHACGGKARCSTCRVV